MKTNPEVLARRLTTASVLLERFASGHASDSDRQEAKRLFLEQANNDKWVEQHQLYPLACLVIEGFGGQLLQETASGRYYSMPCRSWYGSGDTVYVTPHRPDEVRATRLDAKNRPISNHYIHHWQAVDNLRELVKWLRK